MSHGVNDSYAPSPPLPACLWFVLMCCGVAIAFRFRISFKFRFADSDSYGEIQFQHHVQIHMGSSLQRVITMSKVMLSLFALVCAFYCRTSDLDRCSRVCSCNMMLDVDAVRRLPWPLVLLVLLVEFTPQFDKARTLDFSEMFAGVATVSNACKTLQLRGHTQDVALHPSMNILGCAGFALCLGSCLRLRAGGLLPMGPVCSSWVWLCRRNSGRSFANPCGEEDADWVAGANVMIGRVVLLVVLASARCVRVLVEQPGSSLMRRHPRWLWCLDARVVSLWEYRFPMAAFGAPTLKPTIVYSNDRKLLVLLSCKAAEFDRRAFRDQPRPQTATVCERLDGSKAVTGVPAQLKQSQAYPVDFGRFLASHTASSSSAPQPGPITTVDSTVAEMVGTFTASVMGSDDTWADALASVMHICLVLFDIALFFCEAKLGEVAKYMYSNKNIRIPPAWEEPVRMAYRKLRAL